MEKLIAIGRIVRTWGLKGDVAVDLYSGRHDRLERFRELRAGEQAGQANVLRLEHERKHKTQIIAKFSGVDSVGEAERLIGSSIFVHTTELEPLRDDEYFMEDLIGLKVVLESGDEIGSIIDIQETGGTDLLIVEKGGKELLIPFARSICRTIDLAGRIVVIRPPEGLLDIDEV